jgi:hypothetical protein
MASLLSLPTAKLHSLERERKHNTEIVATFHGLRSEHDEERVSVIVTRIPPACTIYFSLLW